MSGPRFTPGPWTTRMPFNQGNYHIFHGQKGYSKRVDDIRTCGFSEANAHLIAAAPDLYAAIEYIFASGQPLLTGAGIKKLQDALAKARGEA